jgi:uncharacterized membrane protein YdjX (TVP38/TMEM64 family)
MSEAAPRPDQSRNWPRRITLLIAVILAAGVVYVASRHGEISLTALVKHRATVDAFVTTHRQFAVLAYIGFYAAAVALSVPGAWFLTVAGGFLFGLFVGAPAAVIGATLGAIIIFLIARTALGEPLLRRAGPRAKQLAQGFRADAFSYLLFLRLVPAFPFFLVNLVPAFAGVTLATFVVATALGVIPGAVVYSFAGTGLDSVIATQQSVFQSCLAAGRSDCHLVFRPNDILTPQLLGAMIALGVLALVPVVVKRFRARARANVS